MLAPPLAGTPPGWRPVPPLPGVTVSAGPGHRAAGRGVARALGARGEREPSGRGWPAGRPGASGPGEMSPGMRPAAAVLVPATPRRCRTVTAGNGRRGAPERPRRETESVPGSPGARADWCPADWCPAPWCAVGWVPGSLVPGRRGCLTAVAAGLTRGRGPSAWPPADRSRRERPCR